MKFNSWYNNCHSTKCTWKCRLQNGNHFVMFRAHCVNGAWWQHRAANTETKMSSFWKMKTFSLLAAQEVVILTTSSAASDESFIKMKTSPFQCRSGSTLAQVMACRLTAPSHYLNQYWLVINEVLRHSPLAFVKIYSSTSANNSIWDGVQYIFIPKKCLHISH